MSDNRKPPRPGRKAGKRGNDRAKAARPAPTERQTDATKGGERIAKRIARSGLASRRDAEAMIAAGRVKVNGNVLTSPAFNVTDRDVILVDGERLAARERTRLFLFHKPAGTMTTNRDPEGRRTVFDVLPDGLPRLMTVGRLDYSTEGLLLMTNDGGLARVLELPSTGWLRRYRARVHGTVDETALDRLKEGIAVDGVLYGAIEVALEREKGSNAWLTVALREGKNREIKKVLGALGLQVTRLIRISYGPFQLGAIEPGAIVELKGRTLRDQLGERLIGEAGADFDAPIAMPFSNKPEKKTRPEAAKGERPAAGRLDRQAKRDAALERLQTKKPEPGRPRDAAAGGKREAGPPRSRASNVWMAPGARPKKPRKAGEADGPAEPEGRRGGRNRPGDGRGRNADRRR